MEASPAPEQGGVEASRRCCNPVCKEPLRPHESIAHVECGVLMGESPDILGADYEQWLDANFAPYPEGEWMEA